MDDYDSENFFFNLSLDPHKIHDYEYNGLVENSGFPPTPASSTNETDVPSPETLATVVPSTQFTNMEMTLGAFHHQLHNPNTTSLNDVRSNNNNNNSNNCANNNSLNSLNNGNSNTNTHTNTSPINGTSSPFDTSNASNYQLLFNESNGDESNAMAIFNEISIGTNGAHENFDQLFEDTIQIIDSLDSMSSPSEVDVSTSVSPSPLPSNSNNNVNIVVVDSIASNNIADSNMVHSSTPSTSASTFHCNNGKKRAQRNRALKNSGLPVLQEPGAVTEVTSSKTCFVLTDEVKKVLLKDGLLSAMPTPGHELTKEQQKMFRKAERKVRNKLSAQNSRLKRKEINENLLRNKSEQDDLIMRLKDELKEKDKRIEELQSMIAQNLTVYDNRGNTLDNTSSWNNVVRNNVMLTQAASGSIDFD